MPSFLHVRVISLLPKGIEQEGLMLGNTVVTLSTPTESPPLDILPAVPTSPEQPEGATLAEPPLEIDASGSGLDGPEEWPLVSVSTTEEMARAELTNEKDTVPEEVTIEKTSVEIPEQTESPAVEAVEVGMPPVSYDTSKDFNRPESHPAIETLLPEQAEEDSVANVVLAYPEMTEFGEEEVEIDIEEPIIEPEEDAVEVHTEEEKEEEAAKEEVVREEAVVEEATEVPEEAISEEDLAEDEILLVEEAAPEPTPTPLSPEKESPFTRVSDITPEEEEAVASATEAPALVLEPESIPEDQEVTPVPVPTELTPHIWPMGQPNLEVSITLEVR